MEILDSGKDKVKKICDTLKKQTLDPAKQEAKHIVDHALKEAEKIVKQAKEEAKQLVEEQKIKLSQEKKAFHSSLNLAGNSFKNVFIFSMATGEKSRSNPPILPKFVVKRAPQTSSKIS